MSTPFLKLDGVLVARGDKLVLEVQELLLPAGRATVLFGENGAGKTTLLMAAAGLLDLHGGRVQLFGRPFHLGRAPAPRILRQRLAFVFQDPYLFRRSVIRNLTYGLKIRGVPRPERRRRAEEVMDSLGISALANRAANALSGGERKLVALGRALALDTEALFLDEVTANLDDGAREKVLNLVAFLTGERGKSVIMATHQENIAGHLGASPLLLHRGRITPA